MPAAFGAESLANLAGVHPTLVELARRAVQIRDFKVVDGVRTPEEQKINIARGVSWTKNSKHIPQADGYSHAIDVAPWPVDWKDTEQFCVLAGVFRAVAFDVGQQLRWGGDWDSDGNTLEERRRDYGHFELVEPIVAL